jgi:hypothetical protein
MHGCAVSPERVAHVSHIGLVPRGHLEQQQQLRHEASKGALPALRRHALHLQNLMRHG